MQREIIKFFSLSVLLTTTWATAAVDPDLFDGRSVDVPASSAESTPAERSDAGESAAANPRDLSQAGSIGGGEPVESGSSKQAAESEQAGASGSAASSDGTGGAGSAGGTEGSPPRDFKDFGLGGVTPGETVSVQSSKQTTPSTSAGSTGTATATTPNTNHGSGSAGSTVPTPSGSGDYGSDLPTGL